MLPYVSPQTGCPLGQRATGYFRMPRLSAINDLLRSDWQHRLDVVSRTLAGVGGGYVMTAAATMFLSQVLPMSRGAAVLTATMLSFAIYAGAIVWAFSVRSRRVWPGIVIPALLLGAAALLIGPKT